MIYDHCSSAAPSLSGSTGPAAAAAKTAPLIDEAPNLLLPGPWPLDRRAPAPASRTRLSRTAAGSNTYRREAPLWCYNKYLSPHLRVPYGLKNASRKTIGNLTALEELQADLYSLEMLCCNSLILNTLPMFYVLCWRTCFFIFESKHFVNTDPQWIKSDNLH